MSDDYEVSLSDIIYKLWRRRGLVIAMVAFATIAGILSVGLTVLRVSNPVVYYISLTGVENGHYPNGTEFAPTDLLTPDVIEAVAAKWQIADRQALRRAFAVRYGSVFEESVHAKYRASLSRKNLPPTEIDAINAAYAEELRRVVQSGLRIELDYAGIGLDAATGASIASALPEFWKDVFPRSFKVFADTRLQNVSIPRGMTKLDDSASIVVADAAIGNMRRGLRTISEDNRLATVMTADGRTAADLLEGLERFATEYFNPLVTSVPKDQGPVAETYIREIELDMLQQQRRLDGVNDAVEVLKEFQDVRSGAPREVSDSGGGSGAVQLGDSALGQIVDLAKRATLAEYVRETLEARRELVGDIAELERRLALLKTPVAASLDQSFRVAAGERFGVLLSEYDELLAAALKRIEERAGALFTPASSPVVVGASTPRTYFLVVFLCALAGFMVAAAMALIMPIRKGTRMLRRPLGGNEAAFDRRLAEGPFQAAEPVG